MKNKKLLPKIKIVSFNENDMTTPLCTCDNKPACLCDKDKNICYTDKYCTIVSTCHCHNHIDFLYKPPCTCDNIIFPKCGVHTDCFRDTIPNYDKFVPLNDNLPTSCECFTTRERHIVTEQVTEITTNGVKTYRKKIDRRTGEKIEEPGL